MQIITFCFYFHFPFIFNLFRGADSILLSAHSTTEALFNLSNLINTCIVFICGLQETWWALLMVSLLTGVRSFYVPGVAPRNFHEGDTVDIKVKSLREKATSNSAPLTLSYSKSSERFIAKCQRGMKWHSFCATKVLISNKEVN